MSPRTKTEDDVAALNGQIVKPTCRLEVITPERASKILDDANIRNRDMRDSRVVHLAENIKREEWKLSTDGIGFDVDGVLLNGQHRLMACVVAEMPIEVWVMRNMPRESQDIIDDTLSRRLGDALKLRGESDVHKLGAGIGWYARIIYAEITGSPHYADNARRPSIPQLLRLFDENQGLRESNKAVEPARKALKLRPGAAVATHYRLGIVDADDRDAFFAKLRTGEELKARDPILILRRYSQEEITRGRGRVRNPDFRWVAVTIKAWNFWREGKSIDLLRYMYGGSVREEWPEPV
jgi:hypothetical protein